MWKIIKVISEIFILYLNTYDTVLDFYRQTVNLRQAINLIKN